MLYVLLYYTFRIDRDYEGVIRFSKRKIGKVGNGRKKRRGEISVVILVGNWSRYEVRRRYEDRPRGYLLLRLVYATSYYYSTPTTCLFLLPTLSTFIRRLFLPLHPANTLFSISPNPTNCGVAYLYLVSAAFSVSCRLVSHQWSGSVDAVPIALRSGRPTEKPRDIDSRSRKDGRFFFLSFLSFVSQSCYAATKWKCWKARVKNSTIFLRILEEERWR